MNHHRQEPTKPRLGAGREEAGEFVVVGPEGAAEDAFVLLFEPGGDAGGVDGASAAEAAVGEVVALQVVGTPRKGGEADGTDVVGGGGARRDGSGEEASMQLDEEARDGDLGVGAGLGVQEGRERRGHQQRVHREDGGGRGRVVVGEQLYELVPALAVGAARRARRDGRSPRQRRHHESAQRQRRHRHGRREHQVRHRPRQRCQVLAPLVVFRVLLLVAVDGADRD
mmetsp:Transcript_14821/g.44888  ORF Transcript_14821/g.44888 Transcript_14821/m.44888 type:complete len:226 (-) Transcript_14821:429-1106(-)